MRRTTRISPAVLRLIGAVALCLTVSACSTHHDVAQGYIETNLTYLSSSESSILLNLNVHRGDKVSQNEVLYKLDPQPLQYQVAESVANVAQSQANVVYQEKTLQRYTALYQQDSIDRASVDQAQSQALQGTAEQLAMQNEQLQNEWHYSQLNGVSPADGVVFDTYYWPGEQVQAYHPVVSIMIPSQIKLVFYIPEPDLHKLQLGQAVSFNTDGVNGDIPATISYISNQAEYTPPVIYSQDTRSELVFRIEAKIDAPLADQWHPGEPVSVNY